MNRYDPKGDDDDDDDYAGDCTQDEVFDLTEKLLENDVNNCAKYFRYNLQSRRCGMEDTCDEPLFSNINMDAILAVPTIDKLIALHDNYIPIVTEEEDVTKEEIQEEWDFIDACLETKVMDIARDFLVSKGLLREDPKVFRHLLHRMWFALFPRAHRVKGSCAFEHVFLGEVKAGQVNGFHNWLFFLLEEQRGDVNYYGFSKAFGFGKGKGGIMKTIFEWEGHVKPVSSIFIGLSPELELALYTICVLLKPDDACTILLGGKRVDIRTHVFTQGGKKFLGTAFPDI